MLRASATRTATRRLFDAGAESIRDVGSATKSLRGCQLGFFGVLHTWGRDPMVYHPHVHFVVPGGGVKVMSRTRSQLAGDAEELSGSSRHVDQCLQSQVGRSPCELAACTTRFPPKPGTASSSWTSSRSATERRY